MKQEFISACQAFLVPTAIFFVALAVAKAQSLKTSISLAAWVICGIFLIRLLADTDLPRADRLAATGLGAIFTVAWLVASVIHAAWWYQEPDFPSVPKTP